MTTPMPVFGECATPVFNPSKPNEIVRYFNQLEDLFNRCVVATDAAKKKYVVAYVDVDTADTWEFLPEYRDVTKTYLDLKNCLFEFYGQKSNKYIITDLDRLVGERQRIGVRTLQELTDFHLKFNAISTYLIDADLLSKREQSQSYFRIFDPALQASVQMRLNIQHQAHHPSMPYDINKIYAAATWALQGTSNVMTITPPSHEAPQSTSQSTDTGFVKTEQLGSILTELTKSFVEAIKLVSNTNTNRTMNQTSNKGNPSNSIACNFCGGPHYIRDCGEVTEYVQVGKCKRNVEGKVVLPSGAYVPRDMPGINIKERCDEWHRRNPNQLASRSLFNAVVLPSISNPTPQALTLSKNEDESSVSRHQLSSQDRIAALEAEIFSLKTKGNQGRGKEFGGIRTRAQRAVEAAEAAKAVDEADSNTIEPAIRTSDQRPVKEVPVHPSDMVPEAVSGPIHPYRRAQDATYSPPQTRNMAAPFKPVQNASKKSEPAYRTLPPIHDAAIATKVYNRVLDTPLTVTMQELLSLSPEVRAQFREVTTTRRMVKEVPTEKVVETKYVEEEDEDIWLSEEELGYLYPDEIPLVGDKRIANSLLVQSAKTPRSIYVEDQYEQYYRSLRPGETPDSD